LVLAVDEKSQMGAIDRTAPILSIMPTTPARMTHDYVRHGTTSLFAALDLSSGSVIAQHYRRHRHQEFLRFLKLIDAAVPKDLDLHLVLDNYANHKTPKVKEWLIRHPRFHLHFTPTSSSWLNPVKRWFAELTNRKLRRSAHRSITELEADVRQWINEWNADPKPFVWTKTAGIAWLVFNWRSCRRCPAVPDALAAIQTAATMSFAAATGRSGASGDASKLVVAANEQPRGDRPGPR
jgi:transposase